MKTSCKETDGFRRREKDLRRSVLLAMKGAVSKAGTAFLGSAVEIADDFLGCTFPFRVRKVSAIPGAGPETMEFLLGTGPFGDPVTTESIDTNDLIKIKNSII